MTACAPAPPGSRRPAPTTGVEGDITHGSIEEVGGSAGGGSIHEALNAILAGDVAPMAAVWSHGDDVTYMGPDGAIRIGWNQVRAS
jgi:hypothetical protein